MFYSLFIVLFFENSSGKASELLFSFILVCAVTPTSNDKVHISCEPDRPTLVFFSCEMAVNTAKKAWFQVCGELLRPIFNQTRNPPLSKSLPVIQALFLAHIGCFHQLMVCWRGRGKTNKINIQTYMNTHTHIHFSENNLVHAWFNKICNKCPVS